MTLDETRSLRNIDDETLLDMYETAFEHEDALCDAMSAELNARGIAVPPCGHVHSAQ